MGTRQSVFATLELDARTGYLKAIFTSAQDEQQFAVVKRSLERICRTSCFGWIKRLVHLPARGW